MRLLCLYQCLTVATCTCKLAAACPDEKSLDKTMIPLPLPKGSSDLSAEDLHVTAKTLYVTLKSCGRSAKFSYNLIPDSNFSIFLYSWMMTLTNQYCWQWWLLGDCRCIVHWQSLFTSYWRKSTSKINLWYVNRQTKSWFYLWKWFMMACSTSFLIICWKDICQ